MKRTSVLLLAAACGGAADDGESGEALQTVVDRMANGSMPPENGLFTPPMPAAPRQLMIDFVEDVLNGGR